MDELNLSNLSILNLQVAVDNQAILSHLILALVVVILIAFCYA